MKIRNHIHIQFSNNILKESKKIQSNEKINFK